MRGDDDDDDDDNDDDDDDDDDDDGRCVDRYVRLRGGRSREKRR